MAAALALCAALVACGGGSGGGPGAAAGGANSDTGSGGRPPALDPSAPGAAEGGDVPTPTPVQGSTAAAEQALGLLLGELQACGFALPQRNEALARAARAHAAYLRRQGPPAEGASSHLQTSGQPGFTGTNPDDRARAAGYDGQGSEAVSWVSPDDPQPATRAVRSLLGAPYHALGLLAGWHDMAAGAESGAWPLVISLGQRRGQALQRASGLRTYPCEGSQPVAARHAAERPSPFPAQADPLWGQPVVVVGSPGRGVSRLVITQASITGPAGVVPLMAIYGEGQTADPNRRLAPHEAVVIPQPLQPGTVYQVELQGQDNGVAFSRRLSFRTALP